MEDPIKTEPANVTETPVSDVNPTAPVETAEPTETTPVESVQEPTEPTQEIMLESLKAANRELSKERSRLREDLRVLKEQSTAEKPAALLDVGDDDDYDDDQYVDAKKVDESLSGLKYDPKTKEVIIDGQLVPARIAVAMARAESLYKDSEKLRESQVEARKAKLRDEVGDAYFADLSGNLKRMFPAMTDVVVKKLSDDIGRQALLELGKEVNLADPDLWPDDFDEKLTTLTRNVMANKETAEYIDLLLKGLQYSANAEGKTTQPVSSDGGAPAQPGAVKISDMDTNTKRDYLIGLVRKAKQKLNWTDD